MFDPSITPEYKNVQEITVGECEIFAANLRTSIFTQVC